LWEKPKKALEEEEKGKREKNGGTRRKKRMSKRKRIVKKNREYKISLVKKRCDLHRPHLPKKKVCI
jgi:hypothetical protein